MNDQTNQCEQTDEEILTPTLSDGALESAASAERAKHTYQPPFDLGHSC
ncbi:MAG TPA: hypothetical protein VHW24_28675 [Bryobacteraceae bacterium]|jgi:hypothetical protein|nr:hypothetical protein [Bryobacteraceae bacterium]